MTMRFVPTRVHGILDYATGASMLALPKLLGIADSRTPARAMRAWGAMATASGLVTQHELGVWRLVPMRAHLAFDAVGGAAMAALPLLSSEMRRDKRAWIPPVAAGASELFLALTTRTESRRRS